MEEKEKEFLKKLLDTFKIEAGEHLQAISSGLIELEKSPGAEAAQTTIETIFREIHSLKGAARSVNQRNIERVCQSFENVFAWLKKGELELSPPLFDLFHETVDAVKKNLPSLETQDSTKHDAGAKALISRLESLRAGVLQAASPKEKQHVEIEKEKPAQIEMVRVPAEKLENLLLQAEELLSIKSAAARRAADLKQTGLSFDEWRRNFGKLSPDLRALRRMLQKNGKGNGEEKLHVHALKLLEFAEWSGDFIRNHESRLADISVQAAADGRALNQMVDGLLEETKKALMLPCSSLVQMFPKMVRDLSREQRKIIQFNAEGEHLEVDRRVLEKMKEPLMHLIRNAVDHGIQKEGNISLTMRQREGNKIEISVSDNGRGIDAEKILAAAVKTEILSREEGKKLNEQEKLSLIFRSGLSTSPLITDLSGRGLGLAIVLESVEQLGGNIAVETKPNRGTTFRILLPLTLSTFRAVLAEVSNYRFLIPSAKVKRVARINPEEIKTVENRETVSLEGSVIALARLDQVLGLPNNKKSLRKNEKIAVALLESAGQQIAFLVDQILGEEEILVKSLGKQLARVRNILGAAILGNGKTVPILNVSDLIRSAANAGFPVTATEATEKTEKIQTTKSILVAEDSITSRTLLKNILESAGYNVKTAVDGMDALTILKTEHFDLLVSDVDMPRASGFELTRRIRSDKKLSDLPVVLVTALESREDKERGIDAGANAYIVKSSFDQSNLLEAVKRLI